MHPDDAAARGLDGVEKMSKSKANYIGITEPANTMYAKLLSVSDTLMWRYYTLLSFRSEADIAPLQAEVRAGRNPKDAKVMLAKEITARFHDTAAADAAERTSNCAPAVACPTTSPRSRWAARRWPSAPCSSRPTSRPRAARRCLVDGGGVRVDGAVVSDRGLRLDAGTYVVQVGKRRFARVTLAREAAPPPPGSWPRLLGPLARPAGAEISAVEAARIERLIQFVASQAQVKFIRNGSAYSAQDAAQFLRAKYADRGGNVTTAAQFIDQIASRSSTTGQAYLMRFPDGRIVPSAQVLAEELARIDRDKPSRRRRRPCRSRPCSKLSVVCRGGDHRHEDGGLVDHRFGGPAVRCDGVASTSRSALFAIAMVTVAERPADETTRSATPRPSTSRAVSRAC